MKKTLQDSYNNVLIKYLKKNKYGAASDLLEVLNSEFQLSQENGRKIISRSVAQGAIKSSAPHTFGKNQFIYLHPDYDLDIQALRAVTKKHRPPFYRLLRCMEVNGIISYFEALKITSSPLEKSSTKASSLEDILSTLKDLNFIYRKSDSNNVSYILFKQKNEELPLEIESAVMLNHYNKMVFDCSVLLDVLRWLGNSNIIDSSNIIYRNKKTPGIGAKHNNLIWDAFAYTRTTGINPVLGSKADTSEKQTLVVIDILLSADYSQTYLDAFYDRIQININSVSATKRKVLPIVIYKTCSAKTLFTLRKLGIMSFDIGAIFGTKIYDVLLRTQHLASNISDGFNIDKSIGKILTIIENAGQDDALKDLKGTLFEFLMYPLLSNLYPNAFILRGKILSVIHEDGTKENYEYDYIINSHNPPEIVVIELKGYNSNVSISKGDFNTKNSLKWFFGRTLPFAAKHFKSEIANGRVVKGCFITSANIYPDALKYLTGLNEGSLKSLNLETGYDRENLLKLLKQRNFLNEIRIIEKFYTKDDN